MKTTPEIVNPKLEEENSSWGIRDVRTLQREIGDIIGKQDLFGEQWSKQGGKSFIGREKPAQKLQRKPGIR